MTTKQNPALAALRHHVTGAIERGERVAIVEQRATKESAMKPATPLPWVADGRAIRPQGCATALVAKTDQYQQGVSGGAQNAAYIVAACNAYPQLVAALREALDEMNRAHSAGHPNDALTNQRRADAAALLRSLGEAQ